MMFQLQLIISELYVPVNSALDIKEALSIKSFLDNWLKEEILQLEMEQEASQFM